MKNYYLIIYFCNIIDNVYQVEQNQPFFFSMRQTYVVLALEFSLFLKLEGK
jgi:hypothetical protein